MQTSQPNLSPFIDSAYIATAVLVLVFLGAALLRRWRARAALKQSGGELAP